MQVPRALATVFALLLAACGPAQEPPASAGLSGPAACVPGGQGFLRARLRGAIDADLDWRAAQMTCEGGPRPDGSGLRLVLAGPLPGSDRILKLVFGIDTRSTDDSESNAATNLTLIVEGGQQLFATLGNDKCTTDRLQRTAAPGATRRQVEVRGFCTGPAATVDGSGRVLVERFDFLSSYSVGSTP
ncbi:MAG: hypothetical protein RLZZ200_1586 [Pseudomonadota bacterium]|jgi:hypothetical protein